MFTTDHTLFTQIMLKHFDRYEKTVLIEPNKTKIVLYVFNQTKYKKKFDIMKFYIYNSKFVQINVSVDMQYRLNINEPNKLYQNAVATGFSVIPSLLSATNIIEAKRVPRKI